ncbi:DUF6193 family natural product biosynthesis protein [Streptomyces sp. NPDC056222]|uniref:DUF6193 family natural product biosynthesis protein n=1 Tax=Streptomyces sp. NPDC056222 TaxID=3345749 RepID=UPI0035D7DA76
MTSDESSAAAGLVAAEWRFYTEETQDLVDPAMARAAYAQPRLRELFPRASHGVMFFSRCTGLPAARVGGQVYTSAPGQYRVRGPEGRTIGETDSLEAAFELVVRSLPDDSGPAVIGTAKDL